MSNDNNEVFASMTADVQEAIKKHLPGEVSATLAKQLLRIPELERQVKALNALTTTQKENIDRLEAAVHQAGDLTAREAKLAEDRAALATEQNNLSVKILEIKLAESEKRADGIHDLVKTLVKNPTRMTTISESGNQPVVIPGFSPSNGYGSPTAPYAGTQPFSATKTVTEGDAP